MTDFPHDLDIARLRRDTAMDQEREDVVNVARVAASFYRQAVQEDGIGRGQALTMTCAFISAYVTGSIARNGRGA